MNRLSAPEFDGFPLDTRTIPQSRLNITSKTRSNLFPWSGQFSPQLIEELLRTYADSGAFVLDPFLGSGTVLHEAGRLGHPVFGAEINPAAFKIAELYRFLNVPLSTRRRVVGETEGKIADAVPESPSLFASPRRPSEVPVAQSLIDQAQLTSDPLCRSLLESLVILLNPGDRPLTTDVVFAGWRKLRERVLALPQTTTPVELANCDARTLPLISGTVDLVVTSPPYINVFNYHQQYRRSVEAMGWNLLQVAKSEIGSNRKHRGNRFLTVIQYCLDMAAVLVELRRVCKLGARVILVVGRESNVRKTRFFNGELVCHLAVRTVGFRLDARQERVFRNRFGELICEDILHLRVADGGGSSSASLIARDALLAARARAPAESTADLEDALARLSHVAASSVYRLDQPLVHPLNHERGEVA